jgi:hypothetical protein
LKIAAIDVLLGNWDGYIFNKNNFYLYHHQLTQQINFLPYDLDNTWGIDWVGIDWSQRNIYNWSPAGESRPLYALITSQPQYRDQFSAHIETLCNTLFHPDTLASQITYWQNLIAPHLMDDAYYSLDFGYTLGDFASAADDGCCQHVPYGILDYIEARRSSALAQLEPYTNYSFRVHSLNQRIDTNAVALSAIISGSPSSVQANYSWDGVSFMSGSMTDQDGDGIFTFVGPQFNNQGDKLYYRIIVNGTTVYPCAPKEHWITRSSAGIRINVTVLQPGYEPGLSSARGAATPAETPGVHADKSPHWEDDVLALHVRGVRPAVHPREVPGDYGDNPGPCSAPGFQHPREGVY